MEMKLELVPLPVTDVDRSLIFYRDKAGFRLDHDVEPGGGLRVVQFTPPGSACSIVFGLGMSDPDSPPGSIKNLHLVVENIEAVREALLGRGVDITGIQDMGGVKYAYFADPDGNSWALQQMTRVVDIHRAGGVLIKNRHFLVTRSRGKDVFVAPGGKLEPGETSEQALVREMMEEVQLSLTEDDLEPLGTFFAIAAGSDNKKLQMDVFLITGDHPDPAASSEIEEIKWINSQTTDLKLGSIFEHDVMPLLKERDLID